MARGIGETAKSGQAERESSSAAAARQAAQASQLLANAGEKLPIARIPEGKMGANVHASIDGTVAAVDGQAIRIER